jgi:hypothetical protein
LPSRGTRVVGVQIISVVVDWVEFQCVGGVGDGLVEVDDTVERPARADPLVDRLTRLLTGRRVRVPRFPR